MFKYGLLSRSGASSIENLAELISRDPLNSRATTVRKRNGRNQILLDYYKCPEEFCEIELNGQLSGEQGFFQFGAGTLCYGRCQAVKVASDPSGPLFDARDAVEIEQGIVRLPFDLTEIVDNLRTERYAAVADASNSSRMLNLLKHDVYYSLRPWMPASVRRLLQRAHLRGWNRLRFPQWPVDRTVDTILENP